MVFYFPNQCQHLDAAHLQASAWMDEDGDSAQKLNKSLSALSTVAEA